VASQTRPERRGLHAGHHGAIASRAVSHQGDGKWFNKVEGNQRGSNSAETEADAQTKGP
jgi:hypothetical protein